MQAIKRKSLMQAIKGKSLMKAIKKENHLDIILGTALGQHQFRFRPEKDDDDDKYTVEANPSTKYSHAAQVSTHLL